MNLMEAIVEAQKVRGRHEQDWIVECLSAGLELECQYRDDPTSSLQPTFTDYIARVMLTRSEVKEVLRENHSADIGEALGWLAGENVFAVMRGDEWQVRITRARTDVESEDDGMLHWFGLSWGAVINRVTPKEPTPVGRACFGCHMTIDLGDQGISLLVQGPMITTREPYHRVCFATAAAEQGIA